jgi:hypothetical protein
MKTIGGFVLFVIFSLMLRDGLGSSPARLEANRSDVAVAQGITQKPVVDPFETTAKVSNSCDMVRSQESDKSSVILGQYNWHSHEIKLCDSAIALAAKEFGVDATALKRYMLAHETAHSRGEMDEFKADKIAVDRLLAAGDLDAIWAYAAIPPQGTEYDPGRAYARQILTTH